MFRVTAKRPWESDDVKAAKSVELFLNWYAEKGWQGDMDPRIDPKNPQKPADMTDEKYLEELRRMNASLGIFMAFQQSRVENALMRGMGCGAVADRDELERGLPLQVQGGEILKALAELLDEVIERHQEAPLKPPLDSEKAVRFRAVNPKMN
jgi:hypothetical protein